MNNKFEKVLSGLQSCLSEEYIDIADNANHVTCPYKSIEFGCIRKLHKDALELLLELKEGNQGHG